MDVGTYQQQTCLQALSTDVWPFLPGYDSPVTAKNTNEEAVGEEHVLDPAEEQIVSLATERLQDVAGVLGERWPDWPCIEFAPAAPPSLAHSVPLQRRIKPRHGVFHSSLSDSRPAFKIARICAPLVTETFLSNGFRQTHGKDWQVQWSGPGMLDSAFGCLGENQRVNHFPSSSELTRKDRLWTHFHRMAEQFGNDFDFVPESYVLPKQLDHFLSSYQNENRLWIVKPNASSQGKGIFLLRDLDELPINETSVVSHYIDKPLLIQGLKFDLRIYVLVTSFDPLRVYVYREGLTRFASSPYSTDKEHLQDLYRHLTNYSINKKAGNFVENQEVIADNYGHKWSLSALNKHLKCQGVDADLMWTRIMDLIIKTLLSVQPTLAQKTGDSAAYAWNCFELYGFDVLVDQDLKPWLLEVNLSPSMQADSPLDWQVKSAVLSDAFNIVGIPQVTRHDILTHRIRALMHGSANGQMGGAGQAAQTQHDEVHSVVQSEEDLTRWAYGCFDTAVDLDCLSEKHLKTLASSLREMQRCRNFIPLYPTQSTAKRYAPIMAGLGSKSGRNRGAASGTGTSQLSFLLAALLFGPKPIQSTKTMTKMQETSQVLLALSSSEKRCHVNLASKSEGCSEKKALPDSLIEDALKSNPAQSADVSQALWKLGTQVGSRLVLMEYLVRMSNICSCLTQHEKVESEFDRDLYEVLLAFQQQLRIFLRTSLQVKSQTSHEARPSSHDTTNNSTLMGKLVSTCKDCLSHLAESSSASRARSVSFSSAESRSKLVRHLPSTLVAEEMEEAVTQLTRLSVVDLEDILGGHHCASDVSAILQAYTAQRDAFPLSDTFSHENTCGLYARVMGMAGRLDMTRQRPLSALLQHLRSRQPSPHCKISRPDHFPNSIASEAGWPLQKDSLQHRTLETLKLPHVPLRTRSRSTPGLPGLGNKRTEFPLPPQPGRKSLEARRHKEGFSFQPHPVLKPNRSWKQLASPLSLGMDIEL